MRILVTGGTGFVGSNIANALAREGHDVWVTGSMHERPLPGFEGKILYTGIMGIDWDRVGQIDAVLHQGAISDTRVHDRAEMLRANFETSKAVFEYAAAHGCKHIVYASSTAVYGVLPPPYKEDGPVAPVNVYGESKAMVDDYAKAFAAAHPDIAVVGLRYCNVYGPGEAYKGKTSTMIYQFAQQMLKGNPKLFEHGEQRRDYIYIKDVVRANMLALEAKTSGLFNCGSGTATTFNDIVVLLNQTLGLNRMSEYIPNPYSASEYQSYTQCDISQIQEKLGFTPSYDIASGIKDYFESGELVDKNR